jgi:prepilin peptidase CpaA
MFLDGQAETLIFGVEAGVLLRNAILTAFAGLLIAAAISDLRRFIIPNTLVVCLLVLWPFWVIASGTESVGYAAIGALGTFLLGALMFSCRLMGGGDVKLLTVLALWSGLEGLVGLILVISIAGGLLSIFFMSGRREMLAALLRWPEGLRDNKQIPYGVAIAVGGLVIVRQHWIG